MGQPKTPTDRLQLFHVNFHTMRNRPVFEVPEYQSLLQAALAEAIEKWEIPCWVWQIMPTHLHLVLLTFPDHALARSVKLIKGTTARRILAAAPDLRSDLGDHLWQEGYFWREVCSHRQYANAARYIRENRVLCGLDP